MKNTVKAKAIEILKREGKATLFFPEGYTKVVYDRASLNTQFKIGEQTEFPVIDAQ